MSNETQTTETNSQDTGSTPESTEQSGGSSLLTGDTESTDSQQGEQQKSEVKEPEGAPEAYDLKLPDGSDAALPVIEEFKPLAKELGLTNEKAQKLVDFYTQTVAEAKQAEWKGIRDGWTEAAKQDKEYGGTKFVESMQMAKKAMDQFGTPELKSMLDSYGMGDHPEVIRLMVKVGQHMAEDKVVSGAASVGERDPAKIMFPSMK